MFKYIISIALIFFISACSSTWSGVKDDSSRHWSNTKRAVHDATAN